jgi:Tfp pilus assembly protein PilF
MLERSKSMRFAGAAALVLALFVGSACGGASEAEVANDLVKKGIELQQDGKGAEASRTYREALVHDPNNKFAYYNLGLAAQGSGRVRVAQLNYQLALAIDPDFTSALFNLGTALSQSDPAGAARAYRRLVTIQPSNAGAHLNLGFVLQTLGQDEEARKEFDRAVALNPRLRSRVPG